MKKATVMFELKDRIHKRAIDNIHKAQGTYKHYYDKEHRDPKVIVRVLYSLVKPFLYRCFRISTNVTTYLFPLGVVGSGPIVAFVLWHLVQH